MPVFIGNIHGIDTSTLETTIQNYTLGLSGKHPIYGVQYVIGRSDGVREYTAQNMIWEPSSATYKGRDDFADLAPFNIKECITVYNSSTNGRDVVAYKGDSNWDEAVTNYKDDPNADMMMEFPKFYYKRPQRYEWLISPDPVDGFMPSPMHYRNGKMHDVVRISKYPLSGYRSWTGLSFSTKTIWKTNNDNLRKKGQYEWDYAAWMSIVMLMMVKYNNMDLEACLGGFANATCGANDGIQGLDGHVVTNTLMGIEFPLKWVHQGGVYHNNGDVFVNTNIENITNWPADFGNPYTDGWEKVPTSCATSSGTITQIAYDDSYPWCNFATAVGDNSNNPTTGNPYINDYWDYSSGSGYLVTASTGGAGYAGAFGAYADSAVSYGNSYCASLSLELG